MLFKRLRDGMLPLVRAIGETEQPRADFLYRHYPAEDQLAFALSMAKRIGYDTESRAATTRRFTRSRCRSPATTCASPRGSAKTTCRCACSARCTKPATRCTNKASIAAYTRTPIATDLIGLYAVGGVSYGAHESQSRLWENQVGRSREFWANHFGEARDGLQGPACTM